MHDIADFERRGIPGVFIASDPFIDAADAQSERLGISPASLYVSHPIQDRTDEEMANIADEAVDQLVELLTE